MGLTNASVLTNDGRAVLSFDPDNPNKAATVTVDGTEYTQGIDGLFAGSDGSIWSGETPGSGMTASAGSQLRSQMGNILNSNKVSNETNKDDTSIISQQDKNKNYAYLENKNKLLPETPIEIFKWMDSLEIALSRRLRNLSHAINVELLKTGLLNSIFPVSLLDAVISGQLSSQGNNSNLLNLKVPVPSGSYTDEVDIICVLLQSNDLEFDYLKLKNCRVQLREYRNLVLKMVKYVNLARQGTLILKITSI